MNHPSKFEYQKAASEHEAAFILCTRNPEFIAIVHKFRTIVARDLYHTTNPTRPVRGLPLLLEVINPPESTPQFEGSFDRMAQWFYNYLKRNS